MTTTSTEIERNPSPRGACAAIVRRPADRKVIGHVVRKPATFEARRHEGEPGVDIRRVAGGFRTVEAALAWIERVA